MTYFKGFTTYQEAKDFRNEQGRGAVCWEERNKKTRLLTQRGMEYMMAVHYGGLDRQAYPFCVQWNETQM